MRKTILVIMLVLTSFATLFSEFEEIITPNSNIINEIYFSNGAIIVGANGNGIFSSGDNGNSWDNITPNIGIDKLTAICHIDNVVFASFYRSGIYSTIDGGSSWERIGDPVSNPNVVDFEIFNDMLIAATDGKGIFYSDDFGESWNDISDGIFERNISDVVASETTIFISTYSGTVYKSDGIDSEWTRVEVAEKINDLDITESGVIYAATNSGVFLSDDEGENWNKMTEIFRNRKTFVNEEIQEINITAVAANNMGVVIGTNEFGAFLLSEQGGEQYWRQNNLLEPIVAMSKNNQGVIYASDIQGNFYLTNDINAPWQERIPVADKNELHIKYNSENDILYAFNDSGEGFKSTDQGLSWSGTTPIECDKINDIAVKKIGRLVVATDKGLYTSQDQGETWSVFKDERNESTWNYPNVVSQGSANMLAAFHHIGGENQLLYGNSELTTWNNVTDEIEPIDNILVFQSNGFILANVGDQFKRSENFGKDFIRFADALDRMIDVAYTSSRSLMAQPDKLYATTNAGISINKLNYSINDNIQDAEFVELIGSESGLFYSEIMSKNRLLELQHKVYISESNGMSWDLMSSGVPFIPSISMTADDDGIMFISKNTIYKYSDSIALTAPVIIYPQYRKLAEEVKPTISINNPEKTKYYELDISYDEEFLTIIESVIFAGQNYQIYDELNYNTDVYLRVRSINGDERSEWSTSSFTTKLIEPSLRSPVNESKKVAIKPELRWYPSSQAEIYRIEISNNNFEDIIFADTTSKEMIIPDGLESSTTYSWRIRSENGENYSDWSAAWTFVTQIGAPQLLLPVNNATDQELTLELVWEEEPNVTGYFLQVANDIGFTQNMQEIETENVTYEISLDPSSNYYWRVAAQNENETSDWSETFYFRTGNAPVELINPLDEAINIPVNVEFEWSEDSGADRYEIIITEKVSNTKLIDTVEQNTYKSDELKYDMEYSWKVRAFYGKTRRSLWSDENTFSTLLVKPVLIAPENDALFNVNEVEIYWSGSRVDDVYQVMISEDKEFTLLIYDELEVYNSEEGTNRLGISGLSRGQEYFWKVRANDFGDDRVSEWSETRRFTISDLKVDLFQPVNKAQNIPQNQQFIWYALDIATDYTLHIFKGDNKFDDPEIERTGLTKESIFIDELEPNTNYSWRIIANTEEEGEVVSNAWRFRTGDFSSVPIVWDESNKIKIFPNPSNGEFKLDLQDINDINKIEITDLNGNLIFEANDIHGDAYNIGIKEFSTGLYFVKFYSENKVFIKKINFID